MDAGLDVARPVRREVSEGVGVVAAAPAPAAGLAAFHDNLKRDREVGAAVLRAAAAPLPMPGPTEPGGSLSWRIGGLAGEGIDTAGDLFAKAALRAGWHVWTTRHFPSRIRGGLTTYTARLAGMPVAAPTGDCDLLVALHQDAADPERERVREDGVYLYDAQKVTPPEDPGARRWVPIDFTGIAKDLGEPRVRNTVALGASARLLGLELDVLESAVVERFDAKAREHRQRATLVAAGDGGNAGPDGREGPQPAVVTVNRQALARGYEAVGDEPTLAVPPRAFGRDAGRLFVAGNEAFAFGALAAGCRFYAGYPITPATTIMEYLAARLPEFGGVSLQVEDELAAVSMAIGAGFMGVRALTATSGPGLSLMAEAMGLAEGTETPLVIVDCMRPGPSTGMPTKTAQEDLDFLLAGGHGEAPRIVLAAEDPAAAFETAADAFNLAERYQTPVYVALDAAISLGKGDTAAFPLDAIRIDRGKRFNGTGAAGVGAPRTGAGYERYRETGDGIPLRAVPGDVGGRHYANSTEHGPAGYTTEDPAVRARMVERRNRKLAGIDSVHEGARVEGDPDAPFGVVAFGGTVPVVREALALTARAGVPGALLVLRRLLPLPVREVERFVATRSRILVVEQNSTGQLLRHLRAHVPAAHSAESVRKYDGEPFTLADVLPHLLAGEGPQ